MDKDSDAPVVVAALLRRGSRCLLVHRVPTRQRYPDCWDLPSGDAEPGETPSAALARVIREQLRVTADIPEEPFAQVRGAGSRMDIFSIDTWVGEPADQAVDLHDAVAFLDHRELAGLKLADPRLPALVEAARR